MYPLNSNEGVGDQVGVVREGVVEDPCELSHKLLSKMLATMKGQYLPGNLSMLRVTFLLCNFQT